MSILEILEVGKSAPVLSLVAGLCPPFSVRYNLPDWVPKNKLELEDVEYGETLIVEIGAFISRPKSNTVSVML